MNVKETLALLRGANEVNLRSCTNRLSAQLCGPNCRWLR